MFGADTRGQAIQIGAVILFSFAVIGFSLYQATVVPNQNAQVEFNHNQQVQQDLLELRGGILAAGSRGSGTVTVIQLGTQYPARIFAVNPGPPSGSLRTVDPGGGSTMKIENAEAINSETRDYWNGNKPRMFTTHGLRYQPTYNEYRSAPTTNYENTVVYNRGPDGGVTVQTDKQRLVDGRQIDLTVLLGSYQASRSESVSVDVTAPASEPRTIAVNNNGNPIKITVPTNLSESKWEVLLGSQLSDGYVDGVSVSGGKLTITLQPDVTYELRVPAAGVGTGISELEPAYITDISGNGTSIPEGGTQQVVAEVRNKFNGPESGVSTSATTDGTFANDSVSCSMSTTDEQGRVSCKYTSPDNVNSLSTVNVDIQFGNGARKSEVATFKLYVLNLGGAGGKTNSGFSNLSTSDLSSSSNSETQHFKFTPDSNISGGTSVTIDLPNTGNGQSKIDYSQASATANIGSATASTNTIDYQAPTGGVSAGTEVTVDVSNVDPGKNSNDTYTVTFTRGDTGSSATAEFTVT